MTLEHKQVEVLTVICFCFFQSSLSVGSDIDLTDTPNSGFSLRKSWDSTQEGVGLEVISQRKKL